MDRRSFLTVTGLGTASLMIPISGRLIAAEQLLSTLDPAVNKVLADGALAAATAAGATYCDVRIGRYLRQFVITREDKVENVDNTESTGTGVRVLANGRSEERRVGQACVCTGRSRGSLGHYNKTPQKNTIYT